MATRNKKITGEKWARLRGAARWLAARTRSGVAAVGIRGFLLLAIAAGSVWGIELARHHVGQMRAFRVYPERFRAEGPAWCAQDLANVEFPRDSYSIFDPRLIRDVTEAYRACPWVASVQRVEKRLPNELRVELTLREPAAFVRQPSGYCAVDAEGVYLPLDYSHWDHPQQPLATISGVAIPPPAPGRLWADRRVGAALSVLAALGTEPEVMRCVSVVDVANLDGEVDPMRSEVVLFTHRNVRIFWGRPADTRKFGEPTVAEKLARLRRCMARHRSLAGAGTLIDLRFPDQEAVARQ